MRISKTTLQDVAREAGASHTAVSLALKGSSRVGAMRRLEIQKVAQRMKYEPRVAAQLLRSKQTGQIGLIIPADAEEVGESAFWSPILSEFVKVCEADNLRYHIEFLRYSSQTELVPPHQFVGGLVDGAIVAGWVDGLTRTWLEENASRHPFVVVDEPAEYAVLSATDEGVFDAVRHLAAIGHTRIAYLGGPEQYTTYRLSAEGFRSATAAFGLDDRRVRRLQVEDICRRPRAIQKAMNATKELLDEPGRPTAIICHSAILARAAIYVAMGRGLVVPADLSVVSFGTGADAEKGCPMLTSIESDFREIVYRAISMLRRRITNASISEENKVVRVRPRLVLRQTVSSPNWS